MKFIIKLFNLIFILTISGCGFHLRGSGIEGIPPIYIDNNAVFEINREIERLLRLSNSPPIKNREHAKLILEITNEEYQRLPLSISRFLLVQEYELIYTVNFQINDINGQALTSPQSLSLRRDYSFADTNQILGKNNEEMLLRQELLKDAARQILNQIINLITPNT